MKNTSTKDIIFTILLFPFVLLFLLLLLIITPFDYWKYKRTRYCKDTHEKYSWLCTSSYYIKLYDLIKKENLPIDYYRCERVPLTGYGYFIYHDILLLTDYEPCFDAQKNGWVVEVEDEYVDLNDEAARAIDECNGFFGKEICKSAVVLIDSEIYGEHSHIQYERFSLAPYHQDDMAAALKTLIKG